MRYLFISQLQAQTSDGWGYRILIEKRDIYTSQCCLGPAKAYSLTTLMPSCHVWDQEGGGESREARLFSMMPSQSTFNSHDWRNASSKTFGTIRYQHWTSAGDQPLLLEKEVRSMQEGGTLARVLGRGHRETEEEWTAGGDISDLHVLHATKVIQTLSSSGPHPVPCSHEEEMGKPPYQRHLNTDQVSVNPIPAGQIDLHQEFPPWPCQRLWIPRLSRVPN